MSASTLEKYVVVVGHGRSGTNMILDLFDCHANTFCRNEPNELVGSAFAGLGDPMFGLEAQADFATDWFLAVTRASRANGARDRFRTDKNYFRSPGRAQLGQALMARHKFRALVLPRAKGATVEEWSCPGLYYDLQAQAQALPVLKILLAPAWISAAHDLTPAQNVVHVIRRPQGFVRSWWSRYVTGIGGGPEKVFADNQPSLRRILAHFGHPPPENEAYSLRGLIVSELWRWRYMNEVLLAHLSGSRRYMPVSYEAVMQDKGHWAGQLYAFAGLQMTDPVRAAVSGMQNTLFGNRKPDGLEHALVDDAVAEVLADSHWHAQLTGA